MENITRDAEEKMQKALDVMVQDFASVRTGKANPILVEAIIIPAYSGTAPMKLMELATIHALDTSTLVITPFDKSILKDIEKGLNDANLGINPVVDENIVRISIPPLTQERRQEFIKMIQQKAENGRVMMRHVRHEAMEEIKKQKDTISEDDVTRLEKEVQRTTDDFIKKIDEVREQKEKELMTL
jgi:ribosome recycling factor